MLSRRRFLQTSSLVSLSPLLPSILANTARAAAAAPDERVLVVVQLDGGNDGINTVVPFADDAYARVREKLRLDSGELHKLDDRVALHRSMKAAKGLFDDGRLCIVQGVGYPNPDRSHFRSMRIWQTATCDDAQHNSYGWLGRTLDRWGTPDGSGPAKAIYIGEQETPVALWSRRSEATALAAAEDLELALKPSAARAVSQNDGSALAQFVSKQVLAAYAAADDLARNRAGRTSASGSTYPDTTLGTNLKLISRLLQSGAQSRVYYAIQGGYDTHSAQLYTHSRLLREFSDALAAFIGDLKAAKLDDRVVVLAFSEFGRRVRENDSQGTDHGTAGPVFLAGTPLKAGLVGSAPDLANLDDGDLKTQFDFRQVYAAVLDDWLKVDSQTILGAAFEKLPLVSA